MNDITEHRSFLDKIKSIILKFDPDARVILFGSRARGDYRKNSDWDLLILLNMIVNESLKGQIRDELFETEISSGQSISTIVYSQQVWNDLQITPLHRNIDKEGIVI